MKIFRDFLDKLNANIILTDMDFNSNNFENIQIVNINSLKKIYATKVTTKTKSTIKPNDLAYCCFTSGTTGKPKGVCVENCNVLEFIKSATKQLNINSKSRLAHSVNCAFDVSVFNIFGCLLNGGCLIQEENIFNFVEKKLFLKKDKLNETELNKNNVDKTEMTAKNFSELNEMNLKKLKLNNMQFIQTEIKKTELSKTELNLIKPFELKKIKLKKQNQISFYDETSLPKKFNKISASYFKQKNITHLYLNSAIFNALSPTELDYLCQTTTENLIVGGETPRTESLKYCLFNGIKVMQIYGPTETTVWSLFHHLTVNEFHGTIIGRFLY